MASGLLSDSMIKQLYTKDAKIWIRDEELVWREAELLEDYKGQKLLQVKIDQIGEDEWQEETLQVADKSELPHLRDANLIQDNDLTSLNYLNEPEVLHNLKVRFVDKNNFYTYCGIVLVAINPYKELPIYDQATLQIYRHQQNLKSLDPHIYAVAEEAYNEMSRFNKNQSIIVSGESGAGKTVSAKHAMHYFAKVGGSLESSVHDKVLSSNPIMEAIGNAKTIRNDNSSRFGKYIQIFFNNKFVIIGATMKTYLLEKSRVVFQAENERNYHIFYQLCASADNSEYKKFQLGHPDEFHYTNQGDSPIINDVDDCEDLQKTRQAFFDLDISDEDQMKIFQILAAILHFGNVMIVEGEEEGMSDIKNTKSLDVACNLLGIEMPQMHMWLCNRMIQSGSESITKPLNVSQAVFGRDALAKHMYARLFNWIVAKINKSLYTKDVMHNFIGVLDIYGFETFRENSFEQFCINYANERLQLQFNTHVFTLEQLEYKKEGLKWNEITHHDNTPCIQLIESKTGILALLDDECKMLNGSDKNWCTKLYDKHVEKSRCFEKPRTSNVSFTVCHFAEKVTYNVRGFLQKNMDTVYEEQVDILKASKYQLVAELFQDPEMRRLTKSSLSISEESSVKAPRQTKHKKTVGTQFRDSLNMLMETLFSTIPHYVRCIKPNDDKLSFRFESKRVVEQLRACGVLETIRISAAGFPARGTYDSIFNMFKQLLDPQEIDKNSSKKSCDVLLKKYIEDPDKYRFGKTKIFFRAGQIAFLDKILSDTRNRWSVMVQKHVRAFLYRRRFQKVCHSVFFLQSHGRGLLARRRYEERRRMFAAIKIQKTYKGWRCRQRFNQQKDAAVTIQRYARRMFAQKLFKVMIRNHNAIILQQHIRGWLMRRRFEKVRHGIILLQSHIRRKQAKRVVKELKRKARDTEQLQISNRNLCNKIIELSNLAKEKDEELKRLRISGASHKQMVVELEELRGKTVLAKDLSNKMAELLKEIEILQSQLEIEKGEKENLIVEKKKTKIEYDESIKCLREEKQTIKDQLDEANERIKEEQNRTMILVKQEVELATEHLYKEYEAEKCHHEKVLNEYERTKQRCENYKAEINALRKTHRHSPSDTSNISIESAEEEEEEEEETEEVVVTAVEAEQPEDQGYGTSKRSEHVQRPDRLQRQETVEEVVPAEKVDISLVLKLQNHIKELEKDRQRLQSEKDKREEELAPPKESIYISLKMQELENENDKLRREINQLMVAISKMPKFEEGETSAGRAYRKKYEATVEELERRRAEILHVKAIWMESNIERKDDFGMDSSKGNEELLNEDQELKTALDFHQKLNRLLENQLQEIESKSKTTEQELREEIKELKKENERQKQVIGQLNQIASDVTKNFDLFLQCKKNLNLSSGDQIEARMEYEILRITSDNLELREMVTKQAEQIRKLKKTLKVYARKLKDGEGPFRRFQSLVSATSLSPTTAAEIAAELDRDEQESDVIAAVRHREREYLGMLEYTKQDEGTLIKNLIYDLQPWIAVSLLPGLPGYIIFMCIRHTDYINDDEKVCSLLTNVVNGIKRVVKKHHNDIDRMTLWLANSCRLLHTLKQYSGEKRYQTDNTPKQNEQCLRNFDLSEYRPVFNDLCVWTYKQLIKTMQESIEKLIVPAILEHEAIAGLNKDTRRGRSPNEAEPEKDALDSLQKVLNSYIHMLRNHAVDPEVVHLIIKQLYYDMAAQALNNLLLRKDMCNWHKGTQIRYNISHLEQWLREYKLQDSGAHGTMEPLIQASQLLQARKTNDDVDSVCQMCPKLTMPQIIKILNQYTPVRGYEDDTVAISFIRKVQDKLKMERESEKPVLLIDKKHDFPVMFPFNPSNIALERIQVPDKLHIGFLKRH